MNNSVVAVVSAFFVIGIVVGIITVIALSVLSDDRIPREPGAGRDDASPDDHPRWPGGTGNDFSR